jgi:hypothetical protein
MAEKRHNSTEEFTRAAMCLVTAQGHGMADTARHLALKPIG